MVLEQVDVDGHIVLGRFQYPLRVEWCWNRAVAQNAQIDSGFSTLYGSNGVGTPHSL